MKKSFVLSAIVLSALFIVQYKSTKPLSYKSLTQGAWSEMKASDGSTPVARHEAAFVGLDDKMYLLGGRGMRPVSIYDTKSSTWTTGAVVPIELHHFQPFIYRDEVYVVGAMTGGYPGETPVEHMYIYNPTKDAWRKGPALPEDRLRGGAGAVIEGDDLYIVCGIKDGHRGDHKKWLDHYNFKTEKWTQLPDAPRPRDHFQAVLLDGKIYSLAGRTTIAADNPFKNTIKEVDVYDIASATWTTLKNEIPTERAGNFCATIGKEIIVVGGESFNQESAHAEVEALHSKTTTWRSLPNLPVGRHGTGVVIYNNEMIIASGCGHRGGSPELSDMWKYTIE